VNKHQLRSERTRQRIVDAAELLFAPSGSAGVSLRQIAAAIDVDLSLVTYHFESKEALYHAVIDRLYLEFTNIRIGHLDALERSKSNPTIIELFDVLVTSWFDFLSGPAPHRAQLLIRGLNTEYHPENEAEWISDPFAKRFLAAVSKAAPDFPTAHVHWTYHLFTGAIVYCINSPQRVSRLSSGICNITSRKSVRQALLKLVEDAFHIREPAPAAKRQTTKRARRK
jgi:AcrR family transcriptional regulator